MYIWQNTELNFTTKSSSKNWTLPIPYLLVENYLIIKNNTNTATNTVVKVVFTPKKWNTGVKYHQISLIGGSFLLLINVQSFHNYNRALTQACVCMFIALLLAYTITGGVCFYFLGLCPHPDYEHLTHNEDGEVLGKN